jgi:glucosamine-phosphate N-acetyltransferase
MHLSIEPADYKDVTSQDFWECLNALTPTKPADYSLAAVAYNHRWGYHTLVAKLGERIVGTLTLFIEQKYIHGCGKVGHVEDVAVHREFQKEGIGQKLMERAVELAKANGCYKLTLDCTEEVAPFYEKVGFRRYNLGLRLDLD